MCTVSLYVCALQMAGHGKDGPLEEEPDWASSHSEHLKYPSIKAGGQIKRMITQAVGYSLKNTRNNNGSVTIYTPTAVSLPLYGYSEENVNLLACGKSLTSIMCFMFFHCDIATGLFFSSLLISSGLWGCKSPLLGVLLWFWCCKRQAETW